MSKGYSDSYRDAYLSRVDYLRGYGPNPAAAAGGIVTIADLAAAADPGQELADIMGVVKPTLMWYGGDASGATELIAGSANLSDGGTPQKEQTDHNFQAGTKTTQIVTTTTDQVIAGSNSVGDVADVPFALLYVGQLTTTVGTLGLVGKRDSSAPNNGWELNHNNGGFLSFVCDSASGATARTVSTDHGTAGPFAALCYRKITANELNIHTNKGNATGGRFAETITNTQTLSVGLGRLSGHQHHFALCALWIDAGESFAESNLDAFTTYFGIS